MRNHCLFTLLALVSVFVLLVSARRGSPGFNQDKGNYGNLETNKEHLQEHLNAMAKDGEKAKQMDDKDMVYYLFVLHDRNGDGHLDGHELRAAFSDFDAEHEEDPTKFVSLDDITMMVDHVLEEDDLDGDGRISWEEYMQSQLYHGGL